MKIGIIGGTGPEGRGLAVRWAAAGHHVVLGSRDAARASDAASRLGGAEGSVKGATNLEAARISDVVVLSVPFGAQTAVLTELSPQISGKIALSVVAPLAFVAGRARFAPPPTGSAAEDARLQVPAARWAAGFHTLPAGDLLRAGDPVDADVLLCGDDADAKRAAMTLAGDIRGVRAIDAGSLESARYLEAATALLININRIYKSHASFRITGLEKST
ncbi:MAG: NADPH-dependent F420 reductase [SAR202 cluster bacterium]|nr:NADPH-dependent F420 reductase [SAR202 cluster bacterium]